MTARRSFPAPPSNGGLYGGAGIRTRTTFPAATDPELRSRVAKVLAELSTISEAEGTSIVAFSSSRSAEDSLGMRQRGPSQSLADQWRATFERVTDERWLWVAVEQAEAEIEGLRKRRIAWTDEQGHPLDQVESEDYILSLFEGVGADVAAIRITARVSSISGNDIRRIRERNDRDREYGRQMVPREARVAFAHRLRAEGRSIRQIAQEMHVAKSTVQIWLEPAQQKKAA